MRHLRLGKDGRGLAGSTTGARDTFSGKGKARGAGGASEADKEAVYEMRKECRTALDALNASLATQAVAHEAEREEAAQVIDQLQQQTESNRRAAAAAEASAQATQEMCSRMQEGQAALQRMNMMIEAEEDSAEESCRSAADDHWSPQSGSRACSLPCYSCLE